MDNTQSTPPPSSWERAEQSFQSILNAVGLIHYLSEEQKELDIAVVDTGPGIEIWPLHQYFLARGIHPRFVGVFFNAEDKEVTEKVLTDSGVEISYKIGDLVYQNTLPQRDYDIIVMRQFEAEKEPNMWPATFQKCFLQLRVGGIMFITTKSPSAAEFIKKLVSSITIEQELKIPPAAHVEPYFEEDTIIIAKK